MIDSFKQNPLHVACLKGNIEAVKSLITKGANPNAKDHNKLTALHFACFLGHQDIVEELIANRADVNAKSEESQVAESPLHLASLKNHHEIVELLLENGADIEVNDKENKTPLHYAMSTNSELHRNFVNETQDEVGNLLSENVNLLNSKKTILKLLENGADIKNSKKFETTLSKISYAISPDLKKLLEETRKADLCLDNGLKNTNIDLIKRAFVILDSIGLMNRINHIKKGNFLFLMIEGGGEASQKVETLKLLKLKGFDIYKTNAEGDNILSLALKRGDKDLIEKIFKEGSDFDLDRLSKDAMSKILFINQQSTSCFSCLSAGNILKITFAESRSPSSVKVQLNKEVSSDLKRAFAQKQTITGEIGFAER